FLGRIDWPGRTSIIHVDDVAHVMIELASRREAENQVYCVASDESPTVGDMARRMGEIVGRPVRAVAIPRPALQLLRTIVWNPTLRGVIPRSARLSFWRLSLIVSDGFWFDTAKFRSVYRKPIRNLEEGLVDTISKT